MASKRKPRADAAPMFGPYELVDGANRLSFGADPVVHIDAGEKFTTEDAQLAAYLDAHPAVKKADG